MEGAIMCLILGGGCGTVLGLLGSGFWEAFALIAMHAEPTQNQVVGMMLGGGCLGAVALTAIAIVVEMTS